MDAHICQYGKYPGCIRKYPSGLCSLCGGRYAVEVSISEENIDRYNKKFLDLEYTMSNKLKQDYNK